MKPLERNMFGMEPSFTLKIVDFWKSIEWPDHPGAMPFVTKISEDMCDGATYYADLIHAKLQSAGYYDEVGQFDVSEQAIGDLMNYLDSNLVTLNTNLFRSKFDRILDRRKFNRMP